MMNVQRNILVKPKWFQTSKHNRLPTKLTSISLTFIMVSLLGCRADKNDGDHLVNKETESQTAPTIDFYDSIKAYDLSTIWTTDSIFIENQKEKIKRHEPLGFIGKDYQR